MKNFPPKLTPSNEVMFKSYLYDRNLCILRKEIYEFMLKKSNINDFYDISNFNNKYVNDTDITSELIQVICKELEELGWNYKLYYGDTGLFIYSENNKPDMLNWSEEF